MGQKIVRVEFDILERFMVDVFVAAGVPQDDAKVCAQILIAADKGGIDSHGINRFKPIYIDRIVQGIQQPVTNFEIVKEGPTTAVIDGNHGMGHVISKRSMQMAIDKAKKYGMGMVAVRNSTHYGIAGYYVEMAAQQGMIGVTGTNARPSTAPTFGVENMLGTNPLTFGMPTDEAFHFCLDCATSIAQRGKIEAMARSGKAVPPGWVIKSNGETSTDAQQILKDLVAGEAALLPLGGIGEETGGHKGYGYAMVVEILSSALQSGNYLKMLLGFQDGKQVPFGLGHFFMAFDISHFVELESFKKTTGEILRQIRASTKAKGHDRIFTPGEKEYLTCMERKDLGIPINESLQKEIKELVKNYKITGYNFPF